MARQIEWERVEAAEVRLGEAMRIIREALVLMEGASTGIDETPENMLFEIAMLGATQKAHDELNAVTRRIYQMSWMY